MIPIQIIWITYRIVKLCIELSVGSAQIRQISEIQGDGLKLEPMSRA